MVDGIMPHPCLTMLQNKENKGSEGVLIASIEWKVSLLVLQRNIKTF